MLYCPEMSSKRAPAKVHDPGMQQRRQLATLIRSYREVSGQGLIEAAEAAGMSRSRWSAIEAGEPPIPKPETLANMSRTVRAPMHEILRVAGHNDAADLAERIATREIDPDIAEVVRLVQEFLDERRQRDAARSAEPDPAPRRSAPRASKPRPRAAHRVEDPS